MQIRKITCIHFDGEFPDICHRLIMPDYGMPLIGTILSEAGYDVKVYVEHIRPPKWDRIAASDLICLSSLSAGADKTFHLAEEVRSKLGIPTIMGGTHATYFPETCLDHCDYVVLGEGDETILALVETLERGENVENVAGIAYRGSEGVRRTAPRAGPTHFDTIPDLALIEGYCKIGPLEILAQRKKRLLTVQASRGCPFQCSFCIVNTMFPDGYRKRNVESVIRDLRDKRQYGRELIFVDNEFTAQRRYTKKLLRRIIEEDFGFDIAVFARVEVAKDDELLSLMRAAGVNYIYQGYESIRSDTLTAFHKRQNLEQIHDAIDKLHSYGFNIWGSFVMGADTDTLETIRNTVNFVLDQKLAMVFMYPIFGHNPEKKAGYKPLIPRHRSIFRGWSYCNGHFVTHFPLYMPPSKLQAELVVANRKIYALTQVFRALRDRRYIHARGKFLIGFVWRGVEKELRNHVTFLETVEDGLYDSDDCLREDLLVERVRRDPRWIFQAGTRSLQTLGVLPDEAPVHWERNVSCKSL